MPIVWAGVIFVVSSIPGHQLTKVMWISWDKIYHIAEFAVLAFVMVWAITRIRTSKWSPVVLIIAFTITAIYAPLDEWHQSLVPDRDASLPDMVADWVGCFIGTAAAFWIR